jgi:hypothetical protein
MTQVHLYQDLKIRKSALKREVSELIDCIGMEEAQERGADQAWQLLNRKGKYYTIEEARSLVGWYTNSHDDCVVENPEEFHPLQVHVAEAKHMRQDAAFKILENLSK